jgi:hypothetical protein
MRKHWIVLLVLMVMLCFPHVAVAKGFSPKAEIRKTVRQAKAYYAKRHIKASGKKVRDKAVKIRAGKRYSVAQNKAIIRYVAKRKGLSRAAASQLIKIARRESTWTNWCVTGSYRGLLQITGHGKRALDPYYNTSIAINEMLRTYKTIGRAYAHSSSTGWW